MTQATPPEDKLKTYEGFHLDPFFSFIKGTCATCLLLRWVSLRLRGQSLEMASLPDAKTSISFLKPPVEPHTLIHLVTCRETLLSLSALSLPFSLSLSPFLSSMRYFLFAVGGCPTFICFFFFLSLCLCTSPCLIEKPLTRPLPGNMVNVNSTL